MYNKNDFMVNRIMAFLGSKRFFYLTVAFLIFEATWIALSGRYPMAFDEDFHFGVIRLYAHHISPFWSDHLKGADAYGAIARDPSYLYQWLMSFPYRLISAVTSNQPAQVIFLRFINVGLFAVGLPLYRKLLLKSSSSTAMVNFCLALFVLIPVVPLLAAQINYDNLFIPMTALILLLTVEFSQELRRNRHINGKLLLALISAGLLTSLVKYAFLPVFMAIMIYLVVRLQQTYANLNQLRPALSAGWARMSRRAKWLGVSLLIVSFGMFTQRFGVNLARYHTPVPSCDAVLTIKQCSAYSPWYRDHILEQQKAKEGNASDNPLVFTADWFYGMWLRSFFAVDGPASNFQTHGPLILPGIGAIVFALAALAMSLAAIRATWRRYDRDVLWLLVLATAVYVAALWVDGFNSFLNTGRAVAINGRYLLPIMPLLLLLLVLGANTFLKSRQRLKLILAAAALACMFWGGGALTYVLRSNDSWYWPNTPLKGTNKTVRRVIGPVTPGYYHPIQFMGRN